MRVIAGIAKGKRLMSLSGHSTRPLLGRIRTSLFDILGARIVDGSFMDLYAGIGSVGIEALSRGAGHAVFIEKDSSCIKIIKRNIEFCGFGEVSEVIQSDICAVNSQTFWVRSPRRKFDFVFLGPPYKLNLINSSLKLIIDSNLINENGWIVSQHHIKEPVSKSVVNFGLFRQEKYGRSLLSFYKRTDIIK